MLLALISFLGGFIILSIGSAPNSERLTAKAQPKRHPSQPQSGIRAPQQPSTQRSVATEVVLLNSRYQTEKQLKRGGMTIIFQSAAIMRRALSGV